MYETAHLAVTELVLDEVPPASRSAPELSPGLPAPGTPASDCFAPDTRGERMSLKSRYGELSIATQRRRLPLSRLLPAVPCKQTTF